jgi:hypothetical protein
VKKNPLFTDKMPKILYTLAGSHQHHPFDSSYSEKDAIWEIFLPNPVLQASPMV